MEPSQKEIFDGFSLHGTKDYQYCSQVVVQDDKGIELKRENMQTRQLGRKA